MFVFNSCLSFFMIPPMMQDLQEKFQKEASILY